MPPLDIVCYYADIGRPYDPIIKQMCASAKQAMPNARRVMLTPTPKDYMQDCFDAVYPIPGLVTEDNLCVERARANVSWALCSERPMLFSDPDIVFRALPRLHGDVMLLWRKGKSDQPINTGLVFSKPGQMGFWEHYGRVVINLPKRVHGWFADQLGFSLMTGVCHEAGDELQLDGSHVVLADASDHCDMPERATERAWALHFKGSRKGQQFRPYYSSPAKYGGGKASPGSVSSTDTGEGPNSASRKGDLPSLSAA